MTVTTLGEELRQQRERAGLSQAAAAEALGLNRVLLNYYESGRRDVPVATASSLARLYGTTLEALWAGAGQEAPALDVSGVLFRASPTALDDRGVAGLRLFGGHLSAYLELAADLGVSLGGRDRSPFPPVKGHTRTQAATAARRARDFLGLGEGPLDDPFRQLDEVAHVWRLPLGSDLAGSPSGFFYRHPDAGFCLVVNSDMTFGRQVFTLAHELAHALFHSQHADVVVSTRDDRTAVREQFADRFAGEFLVPGDALRTAVAELEAWGELADAATAVHLQRHFGVSFATLLVRLRQDRLIDEHAYQQLTVVSPSRFAQALGYPVHPADLGSYRMHPLERFPPRMLLLVRMALQRGVLTLQDAAKMLDTSREPIRQLARQPSAEPADRQLRQDLEDAAMNL